MPCPQCFQQPDKVSKKANSSWLMTMDYWELNKVVLPIHVAVPKIDTIMDNLARVLGVYHKVLGLAIFSFQCTPSLWITRWICLRVGKAIVDFSSASSRLSAQAHNMSWDGRPSSVPVLLFHSVEWAHYIDDIMLTSEDFPLWQDTMQILLEHLQGKT